VIFLPVIVWNYQHDWASFAFQTVRRVAEPTRRVGMDRYETASELAFYSVDPLNAISATSTGHLFGGVGLMSENSVNHSCEVAT